MRHWSPSATPSGVGKWIAPLGLRVNFIRGPTQPNSMSEFTDPARAPAPAHARLDAGPLPQTDPRSAVLVPAAVIAVSAAMGQLVTMDLWNASSSPQGLNLLGAMFLCVLLSTHGKRAIVWAIAVLAGGISAQVGMDVAFLAHLPLHITYCLLLIPFGHYLALPPRGPNPLQRSAWVLRFVVCCGLLLPALIATLYWLAGNALGLPPWQTYWHSNFLAQALGFLLFVPICVSLRYRITAGGRRLSPRQIALPAIFIALAAIAWVNLSSSGATVHTLLAIGLLFMLLLVQFLWGADAAFLSLLMLTLGCLQLGFAKGGHATPGEESITVTVIQIGALVAVLSLLMMVVISEQWRHLRTTLEQADARIAVMAERLIKVQEDERARIARDLHDDINQSIAAVSIQLSNVRRQLPGLYQGNLSVLQWKLGEVSERVRQISHDLHPSILHFSTLSSALESLCQSHSGPPRVTFIGCTETEDSLTPEQKINLFRITQEALHNVVRHAQAESATISLSTDAHLAVLRICDDGVGLPRRERHSRRLGLGMITMEERTRMMRGVLVLEEAPESGTCVEVRIPLEASPEAAGI